MRLNTLYLTDLDGTLLDVHGRLSPRSARGLRALYDAGVVVSVATGRSWAAAVGVLEGAPFRAPLVLLGGARVCDAQTGAILREHVLSPVCIRAVLEVLRGAGLSPLFYTQNARDEQCVYYERRADAAVHAYVASLRAQGDDRFHEVGRLEERLSEKGFYLTARGERARLEPLLPELLPLGAYAYLYHGVRAQGCFLEITPVSKRAGVEELRALTGARRIVAFGDNGNDAGLFAGAEERIAVRNATPEILEMADRVIGPNTEDAVVRCIAEMEGLDPDRL
jgi:hydroxymethylpyrimidine pyrophosphatase-like HAD family hydrolase